MGDLKMNKNTPTINCPVYNVHCEHCNEKGYCTMTNDRSFLFNKCNEYTFYTLLSGVLEKEMEKYE